MEKKINVAELLKDCPKGMELYSPIFGTVYFEGVRDTGRAILIDVTTSCNTSVQFYSDGKFNTYYSESEVTLFPSKSQRDWSKFHRPFKDGDIVFTMESINYGTWISIFKGNNEIGIVTYADFRVDSNSFYQNSPTILCPNYDVITQRLATEEEKQKLFDAIKENGYRWNPETKTLEELIEPKFKAGNWYQCTKDFFGKGITFDNNTAYYCAQEGCLQDEYGCHIAIVKDLYDNFKLWTIQDAKEGDVLVCDINKAEIGGDVEKLPNIVSTIFIFKNVITSRDHIHSYCHLYDRRFLGLQSTMYYNYFVYNIHPATKEQRVLLFQKIKESGYKWNAETRTLEELPKFKVGDRVKSKTNKYGYTIGDIRKDVYIMYYENDKFGYHVPFCNEDEFDLIPNKFDINTLKEFESKVLVRDYDNRIWIPTFWGKYLEDDSNCRYLTTNGCYKYCIPYEHNQHLLGTTNDCDEFYKTW